MDKRTAKRRAHKIIAIIIKQAQNSASEGWSDDDHEHELIDEAMSQLALSHYRIGEQEKL